MKREETSTPSKVREGLFAGVEHPALTPDEPAIVVETFAEQLANRRKKYPIPLAPHVDSSDPHSALLMQSNYAEHRLAKMITTKTDKTGAVVVDGADHPKFFSAKVIYAADLDALERIVVPALNRPDAFIIMAALKPGVDPNRLRKIIIPDRTDAEFGDPPLLDVPRCLWPLDVEGFDAPETIDLRNVHACAEYARGFLPEQFQRAQCLATGTAKHGLYGREIRLRMWFFFAKPITAEFLKAWLLAAQAPFDAGALHVSQPNYTSAPLIEHGATDPLRGVRRWTSLGGDVRAVEPIAEDIVQAGAAAVMSGVISRRWRRRALDTALAGEGQAARLGASLRIRQAGEGNRHKVILREAFFLAHLVVAGAVDEDEALRTMLIAGAVIDKEEDEVRRAFDYALLKVSSIVARWLEGDDK